MAVIIKDMDMPKYCGHCELCYIDADTGELICTYNDCPIEENVKCKDCPLVEIKLGE